MRTNTRLPKQQAFLAAYSMCGNVSAAARLARCARSQHYWWLQKPEYAEAFAEAREKALDLLEAEARRRAVEGTEEPVVHKGRLCYKLDPQGRRTNELLTVRKYSDTLLIFLLKGAMPEKYRDSVKVELSNHKELVERLKAGRERSSQC